MIAIKPSHKGMLHREMGVPQGKKINLAELMKKKTRDMANHNGPATKRDVFAINAKTKFHH